MPKNFLDNGTVLTLGLVAAVAAVGAVRKRGSATTIEPKSPDDRPGMYELVDKTPSLALWKKTYGKTYWLITDYEGNAQLPYGHQDDYPTVFKTLTRAMKVWNTLSTGGAVEVTNAQALRGLGFNEQERGREQKGSRAKRDDAFAAGSSLAATGNLADLVGSEGDDFRTSHLRGKAEQLAEAIKNLVRDMNGREPRGYGSSAFIVPNSHGRLRGTVLVLGFDGGDLFPYMNRDYGDKTKYHAMQDLLRRMGYGWEYATRDRREANVYKLFTDENGPILSGEGNR